MLFRYIIRRYLKKQEHYLRLQSGELYSQLRTLDPLFILVAIAVAVAVTTTLRQNSLVSVSPQLFPLFQPTS